jgi:hypothetical protein
VNELPESHAEFEWQKGYAAFTVSYSQVVAVRQYLQSQEQHHKRKSFKDEYVDFLRRHEIAFDERFLFEGEYLG